MVALIFSLLAFSCYSYSDGYSGGSYYYDNDYDDDYDSDSSYSSYKAYNVSFINFSSETVTVYLEGTSHTLKPGGTWVYATANKYALSDFDYKPSYVDINYNQAMARITFND
jgi:hypothetical protein